MKGVLKGFKYISSIFDEEQEEEIQIGLPTDVKHVAHIGMDGPSTESPSWMKDFSSERPKSAPLDSTGEPIDDCQKTSTDTELPTTSRRRHHSVDNVAFENSDKVGSSKSKGTRKHHKKMNSDGSVGKSSRARRHRRKNSSSDQEGSSRSSHVKEDVNNKGDVSESTSPTSRKLPDIPKKSRRKKVKDEINKIASKAIPKAISDGANDPPPLPPPRSPPPRSPPPRSPPPKTTTKTTTKTTIENTSPFSDPGSVHTDSTTTTTTITCDSESCKITRKPSPPIVEDKKTDKSDMVAGLDS